MAVSGPTEKIPSLFRSEEMVRVQLFIQRDAAHDTIDELGQLGELEFVDLNKDVNAFQRNFVNDIKRCDEMDRKLRFFGSQLHKCGIDPSPVSDDAVEVDNMDELEAHFNELEKDLKQSIFHMEELTRNRNEVIELKHVLEKASIFFEEASHIRSQSFGSPDDIHGDEEIQSPLLHRGDIGGAGPKTVRLGFITGVVAKEKLITFERVVWRATRGNVYMRFADIERPIIDPSQREKVEKSVFIVFFSGERIQNKITKICETFGANRYPFPESQAEHMSMMQRVEQQLADLTKVIERTEEHHEEELRRVAASWNQWRTRVRKEKAIYHTMNMFNYDITKKCLIAEGWCPSVSIDDVQRALRLGTLRSGAQVPTIFNVIHTRDEPPTYFRTNKFTEVFQDIVDSYGIARYQEFNPGPFTIITFPFLFAIMFGDVGHGMLMTLFALFLVLQERKLGRSQLNEMIAICYQGRYCLLLMGLSAIFCGAIYNETFSIPINFFGRTWEFVKGKDEAVFLDTVYPFGVDPTWHGTETELMFMNSLKMKVSVIVGVVQMIVGVVLSALNAVHYKKRLNFWFEFVPQMIFICSIFGYLVIIIITKWAINWEARDQTPPSLINMLIGMFLSPTSIKSEDQIYSGQVMVQNLLVVLAFLSVPAMLLPKPYILKWQYAKRRYLNMDGAEEEEFDFSEVLVHQIIHTIEYVLGCISNTASYLRLWALSLAHAELSTVFWDKIMVMVLKMDSPLSGVYIFVAYSIWGMITIGVLMIMESLSAFLHALRLHWVEFQNKFYMGDGHKFLPFSYAKVLDED
eukprot:TRINITY_DN1589_c0_g1_i2.p1 TRINITY_DN1589_c0_g1~~TRINITY_DN1589_c0_g1_i2.p1  ORF type:complete len:839 (-),score=190.25 TRINITY_DN1589_c0_g1_i2:61-2469(-)